MSTSEHAAARSRAWLVPVAWAAMPLVLAGYLVLRYATGTALGVALAQVVYLTPPMLAAVFAASAAWAASPRTRSRAVWMLLAFATSLMFMSESYYSWDRVLDQGTATTGMWFDLLNVLALVVFIAMMSVIGSVDRLGSQRALRLVLDTGALLTLGFVLVFRLMLSALEGEVAVLEAVRMTAYSLAGMLVLVMTLYILLTIPPARRRAWTMVLGAGIAAYALGMILWPFWDLAISGRQPSVLMEALVSTLFLAGYYLVFMAGLYRVVSVEEPWGQVFSEPQVKPVAWQGVTISVLVLLSVVLLGFAAYDSPDGSRTQVVYFVSLTTATVCMVGRTALATLEADELRSRSLVDPVTGALNPKSFDERIAERFSANRRFGEAFALILLDLDDFGRVNEVMSLSAGDRVLADVAVAVGQVIGSRDNVFRMSSDEFAAIAPVPTRSDAEKVAQVILHAIRTVPVPGGPLTASIGFAMCPDDALQRDALVSRADGALAWAKRHGRDRAIGYDERVERALGADEQLKMLEQDTRMDVARALSAAADARDPRNHFHSRNVAALACLLAGEVGLEPEHIERIRIAAMLHDVGKIALPSPPAHDGRGHARSIRASREHCELGEKMLHSLAIPDVSQWVRAHHERWDGTGYPDGLKATKIPLEGRVIALADAYDVMTGEDRPGGPLSKAAALQEIDQSMGTRFDPVIAEKFIHMVATTEALGWSDDWSAA